MKNLWIIAAIFCLGACAKGPEKTTVRYAFWDQKYRVAFDIMKTEFEKLNPDIQVVAEVASFAQYWGKLEAGAIGGDMADVFQMNFPNYPRYYKEGLIYSWNGQYPEEIQSLMDIYPAAAKAIYTRGGFMDAFPKGMDTVMLYVNQKVFKDAGMEPPKGQLTWDELERIAKELQPKLPKGSYAMGLSTLDQEGYSYFLYNMGGYLVSPDGTKDGLSLPATQAGIIKYRDVVNSDWTPSFTSYDETPLYTQYLSGRLGMAMMLSVYSFAVAQNQELSSNTVILPLPIINGKNQTVLHSVSDVIFSKSKNIDAAKKWITFMNSERGKQIQAEKGIFFPLEDKSVEIFVKSIPYDMGPFYLGVGTNSYPYPSTVEWGRFQSLYSKAVQDIMAGGDPKTVLDQASASAKEFMK